MQGTLAGSVTVAVRVPEGSMQLVWLESVRGWCGTSCPVLESAVADLWHALDVMLLRVPGDWLHARVVWQGREEFLTNAPRRLPNLWKQKSIIEISTFPLDVLSDRLVNWDAAQ